MLLLLGWWLVLLLLSGNAVKLTGAEGACVAWLINLVPHLTEALVGKTVRE